MVGTMWSDKVVGPTIHVTVPSANSAARRSILGPSAATSTGGGAVGATSSGPKALVVISSPVNDTFSPCSNGTSTDRYSSM